MNKILYKLPVAVFLLSIFGYSILAPLTQLLGIENRIPSIIYRAVILTFSLSSIVFFLREFFVKKRGALAYIFAFLLITFFTIYIIRSALDTFHLSTDIDSLRLNSFWLFLIGVTFIPMLSVAMGWESITRNYTYICTFGILLGLLASVLILITWIYQNGMVSLLGGRIEFLTLNPITIGHTGVSLIIFSYAYFRSSLSAQYRRLALSLTFLFGIILIITAGSRGPMLSFVVVIMFDVFFNPRIGFLSKLSALILSLSIILVLLIQFSDSLIVERLTIGLFNDAARMNIFRESIIVFKNNLWLGGGVFTMNTYPHNYILESFVVSGFFGGVIFVILNLITIYAALQLYRKSFNILFPLLFVQYFISGLFSGTIHEAFAFWMVLSIILFQFAAIKYYPISSYSRSG